MITRAILLIIARDIGCLASGDVTRSAQDEEGRLNEADRRKSGGFLTETSSAGKSDDRPAPRIEIEIPIIPQGSGGEARKMHATRATRGTRNSPAARGSLRRQLCLRIPRGAGKTSSDTAERKRRASVLLSRERIARRRALAAVSRFRFYRVRTGYRCLACR